MGVGRGQRPAKVETERYEVPAVASIDFAAARADREPSLGNRLIEEKHKQKPRQALFDSYWWGAFQGFVGACWHHQAGVQA